ncbi:hypothetical protein HK405_002064, partial [Cladochytrium tenue]
VHRRQGRRRHGHPAVSRPPPHRVSRHHPARRRDDGFHHQRDDRAQPGRGAAHARRLCGHPGRRLPRLLALPGAAGPLPARHHSDLSYRAVEAAGPPRRHRPRHRRIPQRTEAVGPLRPARRDLGEAVRPRRRPRLLG